MARRRITATDILLYGGGSAAAGLLLLTAAKKAYGSVPVVTPPVTTHMEGPTVTEVSSTATTATVDLSAILLGPLDVPIPGASIAFTSQETSPTSGGVQNIGYAMTDASGVATLSDLVLTGGDSYALGVKFAGETGYNASSSSVSYMPTVTTPPPSSGVGVAFPAYGGPGSSQWSAIEAALEQSGVSKVPLLLIINPSNGPGSQADAEDLWVPAMLQLKSQYPQVAFLGYQDTCGATTSSCTYVPLATAEAGTADYADWYNTIQSYNPQGLKLLEGCFYDDSNWTTNAGGVSASSYYSALQAYAAGQGLSSNMGNPGAPSPVEIGTLPYWMIYESGAWPSASTLQSSGLPAGDIAVIVNAASSYSASDVTSLAPYLNWIYVAPDDGYTDAPYLSQLLVTLASL